VKCVVILLPARLSICRTEGKEILRGGERRGRKGVGAVAL